jgi:hypothetical protein
MQKLLVLGFIACGGAQQPAAKPAAKPAPTLDYAVQKALVDATARHDAAAIVGFLKAPLAYGGLWFADSDCTQQFPPTPGTIDAARMSAFATCLAALPFALTLRSPKSVLAYAPGIEVELAYTFDGEHAFITGIGHVSVQGRGDTARIDPTFAKLAEGDKLIVPDDEDKIRLQTSSMHEKKVVGSFEVCFDKQGVVQGVVVRKSTGLPKYDAKIVKAVGAYRYQPIVVGSQALDVCTGLTFIYTQR